MIWKALLFVGLMSTAACAQTPAHDMVAPWSINFNVAQRYINAPGHLGDPQPAYPIGRYIASNHQFDNVISIALTESLAHNRIYWSLAYGANVESANQLATFSVGFRAFEFGRRR